MRCSEILASWKWAREQATQYIKDGEKRTRPKGEMSRSQLATILRNLQGDKK